ncbi:MAG: outer membrane beta-barrel protein, partial [Alphaproteobacteria bacterium]
MKDTPSYVETATPVWGGLYIGGSAGFGTGDTSGKVKNRKHGPQTDYDVNGAIYGLHAGYNWQRGNLVYGLEAGFNGTNMDGSTSCSWNSTCERELDWYGTGVARIGYAPGNTLFYGFGGIAWGQVNTNVDSSFSYSHAIKGEETHVGWTAGLGIEHAFNNRFSVRVEYSHV